MVSRYFNPITYCILRFRQLRGGGGGLTRIQKTRLQLTNLLLIIVLVNMQNFKLMAFLI